MKLWLANRVGDFLKQLHANMAEQPFAVVEDGFNIQGWLLPPHSSGVRQEISHGRSHPWRTFKRSDTGVARFVWNAESDYRRSLITRLLRADAESSRKLRPG